MVGLLSAAIGNTCANELCLELSLVAGRLCELDDSSVSECRYRVSFAKQGDLVRVFDDAAGVDGFVEDVEIGGGEAEESGLIRDLVRDGVDGRRLVGKGCEMC